MSDKWIKTQFPGVRYRENNTRKHNGKSDRYFTIRYKLKGILREEGLGWASDGWNAQKSSLMRSELIKNQKIGEGPATLNEKRQIANDKKEKEIAEREKAATGSITFAQYFIKTYFPANQNEKAAKSLVRESCLFDHWIGPIINNYPFSEVTFEHLELIKQRMFDAKQSPRSVRYALAVVRQVFNHARYTKVYEGPSPIANIKFPQGDNKRLRFLTTEEASLLLKELKKRSIQLYEISLVSLRTGARADEIFSLKWGDLDYKKDLMTLWDTKNTKTRLARMTPDIKQMFIDKRSPDFSPYEFQVRQSAKNLFKAMMKDIPGFIADTKEPIGWLNEFLKVVVLHEIFLKRQPKINYSETITDLIKTVTAFNGKTCEQLKEQERDSLKRLNRLLIEETYPLLTPKSPEKTTRNNNDFIFPDRNGNKINAISSVFARAVDNLGFNKGVTDRRMKVVFHTLRHTYASWLVEKGVDLYVVKQLMGHSSLTMTERYSHVGENALSAAVKKLGKIEINVDQENSDRELIEKESS